MIGRDEIARMIPHSGSMCLLHSVVEWSHKAIVCAALSHRDSDNPMRDAGILPGLCGIEYAAQAMAVHGALTAATHGRPRAGYLASLRDVQCSADRLDTIADELTIEAEQLMASGAQVIYQFSVRTADAQLLSGRAAVVLEAAE